MSAPSPEPHGVASHRGRVTRGFARHERLSWAERLRLAVEIIVAYAQARRALRRAPIADVVAGLRSRSYVAASPVHAEPGTLEEARRLGRAIARLLALVPGDTRCLVRSLVMTRLLARRGIPAKLVIGARSAPDFLAHAWVEHAGEPVLDPGDGSFGRLVEL
jgi:transglutaminase superfamily protein